MSVKGGLAGLTFQNEELMTQSQDLDVLVATAHRQRAQRREGAGRGEVGQA